MMPEGRKYPDELWDDFFKVLFLRYADVIAVTQEDLDEVEGYKLTARYVPEEDNYIVMIGRDV